MKALCLTGAVLMSAVSPAFAVELAEIERRIAKEPAYQTKQPKYCLLKFGSQPKGLVWLVMDGETFYADRNGNGDLTEADEGTKVSSISAGHLEMRTAEIGAINVNGQTHTAASVSEVRLKVDFVVKTPEDEKRKAMFQGTKSGSYYIVRIDGVRCSGSGSRQPPAKIVSQVAGADGDGLLEFANHPEQAPIIHFDGPLTLGLVDPETARLERGNDSNDLRIGVGTPGVGKGTTAFLMYACLDSKAAEDVIPDNVYPVAELELPAAEAGKPAFQQKVILKERC